MGATRRAKVIFSSAGRKKKITFDIIFGWFGVIYFWVFSTLGGNFKGERYHKLRVKFWGKDCTGTVFKISIRKKVSEIRGPLRSVSEPLGDADQIDVR